MAGRHRLRMVGCCLGGALLTGCTGAVPPTTSSPATPVASTTVSATNTLAPSPTITPTTASSPPVTPSAVAWASPSVSRALTPADALTPGTTIETVVDRVRVRSLPGIGEGSVRRTPLLPVGTQLVVVGGPVRSDGYDWYETMPLTGAGLPTGWVAQAGRDGEPWVARAAFDCPARPTDLASLRALHDGVGLACFAGRPITVTARLVECNCDVDPGGWFQPEWFSWPGVALLVGRDEDRAPRDQGAWLGLNLDPAGRFPDPLPIGRYQGDREWSDAALVRVTGMFDHPAAAGCWSRFLSPDGSPTSTGGCRAVFATTAVTAVE